MKTQRIVISDGGFRPVLAFDQLVLNADVQATLKEYAAPTPVQAACWPPLLMGRDVVGIAATGSGKTMGFAVPAVQALSPQDAKKKAPSVLVLSPTRELAMQIMVQFEKFKHMRSVCIYGGVAKYDQRQAFRAGVDVVVATPGRMIDLLEEDPALFDLTQISYLVLDEADRMLDCGFEQSLKKILPFLPTQRQTVMFSATWPPAIQKLAETYLKDPVHVQVGSKDLSANAAITQIVEVVQPDDKEGRLLQLLKKYHNGKNRVLVFALYKMEASRVENRLRRANYNVGAIHGNLTQQQRSQALDQFRTGVCPLLVATDVAARGLDIPNVEVVINFTFPLTTEDYCHRIGRTGRAGAKGHAHTLFTHHDKAHSGALINVLREAKQPVPDDLMAFGTTVKKKLDPNYGAFCKDVDMSVKPTKITFGDDDSDA
ncbi:hypothetical protein CXG81DRAFT_13427 [Caulochytrium protostelioides]|uniref:RNA helicase n=1 Tax=Caulochytrium protostelioides TaxID=1555241 RepID=A0A4P9X584_9FUNG|nr:hypothetical protein CXG81DRAFT_13427 [Caulochytrium protostelioides]|eukprot:RKP00276.1 hypothetical protein CXG81DRAFT_13427 [Caulochytrium protostelioides]